MKKLLSFLLVAALSISIVACGKTPPSSAPVTMKDRAGIEITLPDDVKTIISMSPAITQELCEIGLAGSIVGVDTQSPLYAEGLAEDVMKMDLFNPDVEQIVAKKPDILFVSNMSAAGGADPFEAVRNAGICVVTVPTSTSVADVAKDVQFVADCVNKKAEGEKLVNTMNETFKKIEEIAKTVTMPKTVLFEIAAAPDIYSFGSGVFLNEMLSTIGAKNILADQEGWLAVTEESAVSANPNVILTNVNYIADAVGEVKARKGWKQVTAVKNGEVQYIDNALSSLPNHHIADALVLMAKAVYPDVYAALS